MLGHELPGLLLVNPRAQAVSPLMKAGNIYLPHPDYCPWVQMYVSYCDIVTHVVKSICQ
jgi:hypothetical protein